MITAHYFDGRSARLHAVTLHLRSAALALVGPELNCEYPLNELSMAEPFADAAGVLYFKDGGRCEVPAPEGRAALAEWIGYRKSWVVRWQDRWWGALLALVLLLGTGGAIWTWALPAAAVKIADALPPSVDKALGEQAHAALEKQFLEPTKVSAARQAEVRAVLAELLPASPRQPIKLLIRNTPVLGANALALPDGTLIITDGMINVIYEVDAAEDDGEDDGEDESDHKLSPFAKAQLAGVLAHEIGHVQLRHSVRVLTRGSLTAAASAALFGDFSAVAAGLPVLVLNMSYSRDMETEADTYAMGVLKAKGMPSAPLATLFEGLERAGAKNPQRQMPAWMRAGFDFASSHPATAERSKRLRANSLPVTAP
ncbi:MAG: M48 family metallopeptidase [Massilia sp.]